MFVYFIETVNFNLSMHFAEECAAFLEEHFLAKMQTYRNILCATGHLGLSVVNLSFFKL